MKQVWSAAVAVAFLILEGRIEYANYLNVAAGKADMSFGWHLVWCALNISAALVAGTFVAFAVDFAGERIDEISQEFAPKRVDVPK